jgi:hypothetical protein
MQSEKLIRFEDICEALEPQKAIEEYEGLERNWSLDPKQQAPTGSREARFKTVVAQSLLDCIRIDREQGLYMLEKYQELWISKVGRARNAWGGWSYAEYIASREDDLGTRYIL